MDNGAKYVPSALGQAHPDMADEAQSEARCAWLLVMLYVPSLRRLGGLCDRSKGLRILTF